MRKIAIILGMIISIHSLNSQTKFNGFSNVNYNLTADGVKNIKHNFELGEFDLFVTHQTDQVYFLSEMIVAYYENGFAPDMERLFLGYKFNDNFSLQGGKFHIPVGYWNNKFHHGLALQPTIARPEVIGFEDEGGGLMPIHQTGIQARGSKLTNYNIGYELMVSNGINSNGVTEQNGHKAFTGKLFFEPQDGMEVSICGMWDKLDSGNVNTKGNQVSASTVFTLAGAGISFFNIEKPIEFNAEYYMLSARNSFYSDNIHGGFAYFGYKFKKNALYSMTNLIFNKQTSINPFFTQQNSTNVMLGYRYQVNELAIFKVEYTNYLTQIADKSHGIKLQFALGF